MRKIKHGRLAGGCSDACCLKLEGLSVHIQGEDILEDVSFHLHCGEIAALIGPNGAGKSSLFRSILGQMPYSGTITFSPAGGPAVRLSDGANAPLAARGTRPLIGYVPQSPSFDRGDPVSVLDFFAAAVTRWQCSVCGYIYEGEELPAGFTCPVCKQGAEVFKKL